MKSGDSGQEEGYYIFSEENENSRRLLREKEVREKARKKQAEKEKKEAAKRKKKEERKEKLSRAARIAIPVVSALIAVAAVVSAILVLRPWRWYISIPDEEVGTGGKFYYIDQRYMYYIDQIDNTLCCSDWNWDENRFDESTIRIIDSDIYEFVIGKNGIYYLREDDEGYYDLCHIDFRGSKEVEYLDEGLKCSKYRTLNKLKCVQGYGGEDIVYMLCRDDDDESSVIKAYNTKTDDWSLFEVECKYLTSYAFADDMIYYLYRNNDFDRHFEAFDFDCRTGDFSNANDADDMEYYHKRYSTDYVLSFNNQVYTITLGLIGTDGESGIYSVLSGYPRYFSFNNIDNLCFDNKGKIIYADNNDNIFVYMASLQKKDNGDFYYDVICDDRIWIDPELDDPDIEGFCKDFVYITGKDDDDENRGMVYDINSGDLYLELW